MGRLNIDEMRQLVSDFTDYVSRSRRIKLPSKTFKALILGILSALLLLVGIMIGYYAPKLIGVRALTFNSVPPIALINVHALAPSSVLWGVASSLVIMLSGVLPAPLIYFSRRAFVACVAINVVIAGAGAYYAPPSPEVNITAPVDGSHVGSQVIVYGTWSNIPSDQRLWLVVYSSVTDIYYPQVGPIPLYHNDGSASSGVWSGLVYVGNQNSVNQTYMIIAVLANSTADNAFTNYLAGANANYNYTGLPELPQGASECSIVSVTPL
jgi:hypothetical protein